jgi:hypothetical protein
MHVIQINLNNKKQVDDFLHLPFFIYKDIPQWVPPLQMDERLRLSPKRFPFYQHSQASFFLAYDETHPVGRLAVLDNRRYNEFNKTKTAFFYLFECENNQEAATALFNAAFNWARAHGLENITGPKGFTPLDGFGLLVKGFEHRPAFGLPYNPAYYVDLIEAQGVIGGVQQIATPYDDKLAELSGLSLPTIQRMEASEGNVRGVVDTLTNSVVDRVPLQGHSEPGYKLRISPDGSVLITCAYAGTGESFVNVVKMSELHGKQLVVNAGKAPMGFAFAPDGRTALVANDGDGTVTVVDFQRGAVTNTFKGGTGIETLSYY